MDLSGKGKSEFGVLPAGWYQAVVTKSEIRQTNDRTGRYINASYTIVGADYTGRIVFQMYNLENKNPKAVEIAEQQMASVLVEMGYKDEDLKALTMENIPPMLANKEVGIRLKIQVDPSGRYEDKNVIVGYRQCSNSIGSAALPNITTEELPF